MTSTAGPPRSRLRALSCRDILTVGLPVALVIGLAFAFASRREARSADVVRAGATGVASRPWQN
jgi:hypothetical protein